MSFALQLPDVWCVQQVMMPATGNVFLGKKTKGMCSFYEIPRKSLEKRAWQRFFLCLLLVGEDDLYWMKLIISSNLLNSFTDQKKFEILSPNAFKH